MVGKAPALNYKGPSLGSQVEGLPSARHTEAVWGPHGVFGPAPIHAHDHGKSRIEDQNDSTMPERLVQVRLCIVALLLGYIESKISCQTLKLNPVQNLIHRPKIMFFLIFSRF